MDPWLNVLCMRSKTWLAARVSLQLARLPRTARCAQRSRRLRSTRAAAPVLLAHANVTESINIFLMGPNLRYPMVPCVRIGARHEAKSGINERQQHKYNVPWSAILTWSRVSFQLRPLATLIDAKLIFRHIARPLARVAAVTTIRLQT